VALCTAQTQRTNAVSRDGLAGGAPGASEAQVEYSGESKPGMGVKKRDGNLESCLALDLHGHEVDHPPPQFYQQAAQGGLRGEVLAARFSRVTGPGSAAEVGQWHGALLPGLAGPLGILAAFRHALLRSKVCQGFQQGRRVAFFVAVTQQPSGLHHNIA